MGTSTRWANDSIFLAFLTVIPHGTTGNGYLLLNTKAPTLKQLLRSGHVLSSRLLSLRNCFVTTHAQQLLITIPRAHLAAS